WQSAATAKLLCHRHLDVGKLNELVFEMMLSGQKEPAEWTIFFPRAMNGRVGLWNVIPRAHEFGLRVDIKDVLVVRSEADLVETQAQRLAVGALSFFHPFRFQMDTVVADFKWREQPVGIVDPASVGGLRIFIGARRGQIYFHMFLVAVLVLPFHVIGIARNVPEMFGPA